MFFRTCLIPESYYEVVSDGVRVRVGVGVGARVGVRARVRARAGEGLHSR